MHAFSFGEEEFGIPDPELGFSDERRATLGELIDIGARFRYTYDFGDNWEHEILVEDLLDREFSHPGVGERTEGGSHLGARSAPSAPGTCCWRRFRVKVGS